MRYRAEFAPSALKTLRGLSKELRCILGGTINGLQESPRADGVEALEGFSPTRFKFRRGDYRIVFEVDDEKRVISILKVIAKRSTSDKLTDSDIDAALHDLREDFKTRPPRAAHRQ